MSDPGRREPKAAEEAAAWFARLGRRSISTDDLRAFRDWRRRPQNDAAYSELETVWAKAAGLATDPEIRQATLDAYSRPKPAYSLRRGEWLKPISAGVLVLLAASAVLLGRGLFSPSYATAVGEQRIVTLDDGSRMRLNTNSKVRVDYSREERRIRLLKGEAFFEAANDADRPFVIDAGEATVRALGTRFDVRRDAASGVLVTLVEGRVEVREPKTGDAWTLESNQAVRVNSTTPERVVSADPALATGWTAGRLTFRDARLADAVAEVNRYSRRQVVLEAPDLDDARVSGVFDTGDAQAFAAAVGTLYGMTVAAGAGEELVLRPSDVRSR